MTTPAPDNLVSSTWEKPIEAPETMQSSADVVIIGGGIIGVSTAWFLTKQGFNVVLCEKGHIAGEQSGRNWGWVRKQCRDERELPMMIKSMEIWRELTNEENLDLGFHQSGCIYATECGVELGQFEDWLPTAKHYGLDTKMLSKRELNDHVSGASLKWVGGLCTPSDGRGEPHKATPTIANAAKNAGATVLTGCAVRGLETTGGRVSAVVTEHGTIKTSIVLCAGGAWTSMFCRSVGINLPQLKVKGTVVRTRTLEQAFDGELYGGTLGMRRREDGGYTLASESYMNHPLTPSTFRYMFKFLPAFIEELKTLRLTIGADFINELLTPKKWPLDAPSPFENNRVLNPDPDERIMKTIKRAFYKMFPSLEVADFAETWAGMIETTPDVVPIIEDTAKIPGFYVATGFSGHGFGIGPGAGYAIAGLISGNETGIDLSPFKLARFYNGSKIIINQKI